MKKLVIRIFCSGIAIVCGVGVFWAIFAAPILLGKYELMMAWGWVGWIPGILMGHSVGQLAYRFSYERFQ